MGDTLPPSPFFIRSMSMDRVATWQVLFQELGSGALREHRTGEKLNQQVIKDANSLGEGKGRRELGRAMLRGRAGAGRASKSPCSRTAHHQEQKPGSEPPLLLTACASCLPFSKWR